MRGFRIFLACLALGVAAIAAAGSTAEAFRQGLASQAREILGGDLAVTRGAARFTPAERAALAAHRAASPMRRAPRPWPRRRRASGGWWSCAGSRSAYPLAGKVDLAGAASLAAGAEPRSTASPGAAVEQPLLDRLGLKLGDRFLVGNVPLVARAVLVAEPDRLSRGFALGPRVLTRLAAVEAGGFLSPGLPFGETARIALPPGDPWPRPRRRSGARWKRGSGTAAIASATAPTRRPAPGG